MERATTLRCLRGLPLVFAASTAAFAGEPATAERSSVIIVVGAAGAPAYGEEFDRWAGRWEKAARRAGARLRRLGGSAQPNEGGARTDRDLLRDAIDAEERGSAGELWIVLIGHGTFDGRTARFNLRGPDVAASDLARWLDGWKRPLVVVNCASASAPFINRLSGPGRVIVTATKSGYEYDYARFGRFLSEEIVSGTTDIDKDGQLSLLEAFVAASARTAEFYDREARLATEHALVDDNGDGLGTPSAAFRGIRPASRDEGGPAPDGPRAHRSVLVPSACERRLPAEFRRRRDDLELALEELRAEKGELDAETYYGRLEPVLLDLARLYEGLDEAGLAPKG